MNEVYHQMTLSEWDEIKQKIKKNLFNIAESYVAIGYNLKLARDKELYRQDGYSNMEEFAKQEFGISKSAVSRFIRIQERYAVGEQLKPEYVGFKQSILADMLSLSEEQSKMITTDAQREQVRELKHFEKEDPKETIGIEKALIRFFVENPDDYEEVIEEEDPEEIADILSPSGSRTYQTGDVYIWFYDARTGIKYRIFGKTDTMEMSYCDLMTVIAGLKERIEEKFEEQRKNEYKTEEKIEENSVVNKENTAEEKASEAKETWEKVAPAQPKEEPENREYEIPVEEPQKVNNYAENQHEYEEITEEICEEVSEIPEEIPQETEIHENEETKYLAGSRKRYLDSLKATEAATYLAKEYREYRLKPSDLLRDYGTLDWLEELVDQNGEPFEGE